MISAAATPAAASASSSSSSAPDWQRLKSEAAVHFAAKRFDAARRGYESAIRSLTSAAAADAADAAASPSAQSLPSVSASSPDLCVLYSNVSLCAFQLGDYPTALAAADRAIEADASFLKAHLRRALALEKLATNNAGAAGSGETAAAGSQNRAALQLQEAIRTAQKIAQILKSQQQQSHAADTAAATAASDSAAAAPAPATPAASGPSLAEVTSTLVRLRSTLANLHARAASPLPFLQALREAAAASPSATPADAASAATNARSSLHALMQLIASSGAARVEALQAGLIEVLMQLSLRDALSMRTRAKAVRAARLILGTDLASAAGSSSLDFATLRTATPELIRLFESLRTLQSAQSKQVPPPLPSAVAALGEMMRALCGLLARLAVHPRLEHAFTAQISSALSSVLPRYATHSPAALAALWSSSSSGSASSSGAALIRLCIAAIDALTFVASSPFMPAVIMSGIRSEWMGLLLLEPLAAAAAAANDEAQASSAASGVAGGAQLRASILGAVAVLTRNAMPRSGAGAAASAAAANSVLASMSPMLSKAFGSAPSSAASAGEEMSDEQAKALEAEGAEIREQSLRLIYAPLIGSIEAPAATSTAAASSELTPVKLNYTAATRLVRGLSLLLQANTMLGIFVVTFGAAAKNDAAASAAAGAQTSAADEEQKQKESADTASSSSAPAAPTPAAAPTVLHLLLSLSSYVSHPLPSSASVAPPKPLQLLAAEVLALASSDSSIRSTLVALSDSQAAEDEELRAEGLASQARGADVFMDLIVQYTEASDLGIEDEGQQLSKGSKREEPKQQQPQPPPLPSADSEVAVVPNETIVAHACLALSKLVAVGEWGSSVALPALASSSAAAAETEAEELDISDAAHADLAILLHILTTLIERHLDDVPRVERAADKESKAIAKKAEKAAAAAAQGESDEGDASTDEDDSSLLTESLRLQRVSLLHLLFESLSYLSLHAYAKKWIVAERGGRALRMLVGIATGTSAANGSAAASSSSSSSAAAASTLGVVSDSTIRYALLHCFRNLVTSRSSLEAAHNAEVEALKKLASRGLGAAAGSGGGAALNEQQNARQQFLAGSAPMIALLSKVLASARVGAALCALHKAYVIQAQEMEGAATPTKSGASSGSAPAASAHGSNAILSVALANTFAFTLLHLSTPVENRGMLVQQGCVRLLLDLYAGATKPGDGSAAAAQAASDETASPSSPNSPFRASTDCLLALARLFISTNPSLVAEAQLPSVVLVLLEGLASSEHELQTFEVLMALTNLASFKSGGAQSSAEEGGLDLAEHICVGAASARSGSKSAAAAGSSSRPASSRSPDDLNGWFLAKSNLLSTNPMVQRACVELMTNLVGCEWVRTRMRAVPVELRMAMEPGLKVTKSDHAASYASALANPGDPQSEDLRLLLAFALSEDLETARAATGALAMLSSDELIAARIACTRVVSYVSLDGDEEKRADDPSVVSTTAEEGRQAPPNTRPLVRSGTSICNKLMSDTHTHPDVKLRVQVLRDNMEAASQAVAGHKK